MIACLLSLVGLWGLQELPEPVLEVTFAEPVIGGGLVLPGGMTARLSGAVAIDSSEFVPGDDDGAEQFAARLDGHGASLRIAEPADSAALDFGMGDTVAMAAWLDLDGIGRGQNVYVLGKGRTHRQGVPPDNQNYALRLRDMGKGPRTGRPSLLFRSAATAGSAGDWHRWTADRGIVPGSGWRHVVLSYTFGEPDSVACWLDGRPVEGTWDMGGATAAAPVVDDDELWLGTALGGAHANSFRGRLGAVALYRHAPPATAIADLARHRTPPPRLWSDKHARPGAVVASLIENVPDVRGFAFRRGEPSLTYALPAFGLARMPVKYDASGERAEWTSPSLLVLRSELALPSGDWRLTLRSVAAARLLVDDEPVADLPFRGRDSAHNPLPGPPRDLGPDVRFLRPGDVERVVDFRSDGEARRFQLEVFLGGRGRRPDLGETLVAVSRAGPDAGFTLLAPSATVPLTDAGWAAYVADREAALVAGERTRRAAALAAGDEYWRRRHALAAEMVQPLPVPPTVSRGDLVSSAIDRFVVAALEDAGAADGVDPPIDDLTFLRRVTLDITGTVPTLAEIAVFEADAPDGRRGRAVDRLLASAGWADHWVSYWQDVLAENPSLIKPTLNNSGPFRLFLHEALTDDVPLDRLVTRLVALGGDTRAGGPAGFGMASENDVPLAEKAVVLGRAFLAVDMTCARCHDAPFHDVDQADLFGIAAMLARGPLKVPATSSVPVDPAHADESLIEVTLAPGTSVPPRFPFDDLMTGDDRLLPRRPGDPRHRLASLLTSPANPRFARVAVNRVWRRLLGVGLASSVDDWESAKVTHPELLAWLADRFVADGYDLKTLVRRIVLSRTYARGVRDEPYLFDGRPRRRLSAEQVVDGLHTALGKPIDVEELLIDRDATQTRQSFLNLGRVRRAWQLTGLSNERDRPSLTLPKVRNLADVMEAFGWRSSRPQSLTDRDDVDNVYQPASLANGPVVENLVRLTAGAPLADLALAPDLTPARLAEILYLRLLTRRPTAAERDAAVALLAPGFAERVTASTSSTPPIRRAERRAVSWSDHFDPQANLAQVEMARQARRGPPPTDLLAADWRERAEDLVWALVNSPEFIFAP